MSIGLEANQPQSPEGHTTSPDWYIREIPRLASKHTLPAPMLKLLMFQSFFSSNTLCPHKDIVVPSPCTLYILYPFSLSCQKPTHSRSSEEACTLNLLLHKKGRRGLNCSSPSWSLRELGHISGSTASSFLAVFGFPWKPLHFASLTSLACQSVPSSGCP